MFATSRKLIQSTVLHPGFIFWPKFFSLQEQCVLLAASLYRLDSTESRRARKKREKHHPLSVKDSLSGSYALGQLFAPDELYEFQEGHYDGVIHNYREMHLAKWPTEEFPQLQSSIDRLHSLCPTPDIQTHLLHLSSKGDILPHIDNVAASGNWILGVSLGDERILRLRGPDEAGAFDLNLPSGSVYLQRDSVRFKYKHSIDRLPHPHPAHQRLSIMIRDKPSHDLRPS
ncbi:hypothetical protein CVT24_010561 [Panaeolus cyanescens]|uniref:Alpha-ketoglutarate-dependent dioxygenase AlkB-like domain-containing protein n=1 Tax=Panaeolus cyanescens TaxID=181874 RepID=A0A409YYK3_9AGAR|nr:hypothetical protein CVT24_010561 [Panaeolus cyanescens]